jgi:hypothetical protein
MPKSPSSSSFPLAVRCVVRRSTSAQLGRQFRIQKFASTSPKILAQQCRASLDELWFSPSSPRLLVPSSSRRQEGLNGGADHKPPDERILKLGKSTFCEDTREYFLFDLKLICNFSISSSSDSVSATSHDPHQPATTGHSLPEHHITSLPIDASSSTNRQGSCLIPSSFMDGPCRLE